MNYFEDDSGQGLVEYALLLLLVSIAVVFVLALFGNGLNALFSQIYDGFTAY